VLVVIAQTTSTTTTMQPCTEEAMMLNHNFTMMNEDETTDPVGTVILPSTTTTSKTVSRTTGPRSFGRMMALVGTGLLLLLLMAEGAVVVPEEAVAEGALWSDPISSSPGRQGRVVGAGVAEEGVVMTENGHDTTTSRRYDFAAAAAAGAGAIETAQDGSRLHAIPRRHETTEEDGIEMTEDGSRTHESSTPRRVNIKHSKKTSQSQLSEQSGSTSKSKTLYLIRHANKQCGDDHDAKLCAAGDTRAEGLKTLFDGNKRLKPEHLFAYYYEEPKYKAQRCYDTLGPIAKALGTSKDPNHTKYIHKVEFQRDKHRNIEGAHAIRKGEYGLQHSDVVLAAWEHVHMEEMAHELGMDHTQHEKLGYGRKKKGQ